MAMEASGRKEEIGLKFPGKSGKKITFAFVSPETSGDPDRKELS